MESCSNEISVYGPSYCTFIVRRMRFLLLLLNMCETLHNGDDTGFTKIFLLNPNSHQFEYHSENVWLEHANV